MIVNWLPATWRFRNAWPAFRLFHFLLSALALVKGSVQVLGMWWKKIIFLGGLLQLPIFGQQKENDFVRFSLGNFRKDTWILSYAFVIFDENNREYITAQCSKSMAQGCWMITSEWQVCTYRASKLKQKWIPKNDGGISGFKTGNFGSLSHSLQF